MDEEACERFFSLDKAGRRKESKLAFRDFVGSFQSEMERDNWARDFLESQKFFNRFDEFGIRVRQELFDEILWPLLNQGIQKEDTKCLFWLAALQQNLFAPQYRARASELDRLQLLRRAYDAEPHSLLIGKALLAALLDLFRYADHEWPSGILTDGPEIEALSDYERLIELARNLDIQGRHTATLNDFAVHVQLDRQRLSRTK